MSKNYSSHASLDQSSRFFKAKKIEQLLASAITIKNAEILDIGTGSGYIAHYLAATIKPDEKITSIDVADQRKITSDYTFKEYSEQQLPFKNESFDIIMSNHVIEHVGDRDEQKKHLKEIYRVLKPKGFVYFAVPNKWTIIEPHYKLPFLSWLPHNLASKYIKTLKKGTHYDCYPPSHNELITLFKYSSFSYTQKTFKALKLIPIIENKKGLFLLLTRLPHSILKLFYPIIPSMIFLLHKE